MEAGPLLIILVVLCAVVALLYGPLRLRGAAGVSTESADRIAELQARKEAKYREIRDAEMDMRTGKLSEEDYRILGRQLRAEAIEILRELDEAQAV